MPLLDNNFTGITPNVYLENKPQELIAPAIKPFDIEITKELAAKTQIPDNYKRAFESLQSETKNQFILTGDTFSTKDSNVYGVQGLNYTPGVDNEGIAYLKQDNTLSKGVSGMFDVAKASFFSQINTIPNLFSSIVSGEDVFRDNEQNKYLAESLRKLEEDNNKIFKSADQRENPLAPRNIFSKENFSSLLQQEGFTVGTIGGILLENLALKAAEVGLASTGVGTGAAVALEGAEDIKTAIGISKTLGTTGKAIKDILTGVSTLSKSYAAAKGINQAGRMVKALNLTELGIRAFLHANGEAALQKHIAREDIIKSLVDQEGKNITQERLDEIHALAEQGSNTEYYLNLPLLMVSDMYQFGNVLMGKQLNNVLDKFPISAKLTGGALEFSGKAPSFGRYLANKSLDFILKSQTEGLEGIAQYGIENFTRDYYKDIFNKKTTDTAYNFVKYLGKGAESMFDEEGLNQYISGVLIGGMSNVGLGTITSIPQIASNPKRFFTPYSAYKETIENAFTRNNILGENTLKYFSSVARQNEAFHQGDKAKFNDELAKQIFDFTDTSLKRGTFAHISDTIKSWSTLDNEQFNASGFAGMGENLNPEQQKTYVNSILEKINLAKESIENTQRVFKVNPFENENWFIEKIKNRGKSKEDLITQEQFKAQSSHVFNQLRNVAAYLTFKKENQNNRFTQLEKESKESFQSDFVDSMLKPNPSIKNYLTNKLKEFEEELSIYEEGIDPKSINSIEGVKNRKNTLKNIITAINSVKDNPEEELVKIMSLPDEVKDIIVNADMSIEEFNRASEKLVDSYKLKQSINTLNNIYKSWGTLEGQKQLINSILDNSDYSTYSSANTNKTSTPASSIEEKEPTTSSPKEDSIADFLAGIPLAEESEYINYGEDIIQEQNNSNVEPKVLNEIQNNILLKNSINKNNTTKKNSLPSIITTEDTNKKRLIFEFLNNHIGEKIKINDKEGKLIKINNFTYELHSGNFIYEFQFSDIEFVESLEKKNKYEVKYISEDNVVVNNVEYQINSDNKGNIVSVSPKNNPYQQIHNEKLLIAVEIERAKHEFKTISNDIEKEIINEIRNEYQNLDQLLEIIFNINMTDTIVESLDSLYNDVKLNDAQELQISLWLSDAFDRIVKLNNSKNTQQETETILNAYNTLEIINNLLYNNNNNTINKDGKQRKSATDAKQIENNVSTKRNKKEIVRKNEEKLKNSITKNNTTKKNSSTLTVEAKKADIERRRQEELDRPYNNKKQELADIQEIASYGETYSEALNNLIKKQEEINNALNKKQKEDTKNRTVKQYEKEELEAQPLYLESKRLGKLMNQLNEVYGSAFGFDAKTTEGVKEVEKELQELPNKRKTADAKINAKYDAEYVDAVKKGEITKEQAMQALEEVGRKDSSAYAKIAALEQNKETIVEEALQKEIKPGVSELFKYTSDKKNLSTIESVINQIKDCKS